VTRGLASKDGEVGVSVIRDWRDLSRGQSEPLKVRKKQNCLKRGVIIRPKSHSGDPLSSCDSLYP